jgi:peptidoglycan/xylan/chitin deacetylase (PgdA/CDA1 family)
LIRHGVRSRPAIALTFDACQSPDSPAGYDAAVVDALIRTQTPATLFLGGLWMKNHPVQTRALAENPLFELGNHSWSHADFATLSPPEIEREIERTQALLRRLGGQQATLFRFPGGSHTDLALQTVSRRGLRAIQWDVVSGDPDPAVSTADIVREVMRQAQNGSIVIMHVNGWGHHTAQALPDVIRRLREQGYTFVTVSELLAADAEAETGR